MKIVIYSDSFAPSIGGVQTYVMLLARGLAESDGLLGPGSRVTLITQTAAGTHDDAALPFQVVRRPGWIELLRLIKGADIVHLAGPTLLPLMMAFLYRRRTFVEHHGYQAICLNGLLLCEPEKKACPGHFMARRYRKCFKCEAASAGGVRALARLFLMIPRRWLCARVSHNLPITEHVRDRLRLPHSQVVYYGIPDPLAGADDFGKSGPKSATGDATTFAYVGRLVSEKGLHLLVEAAERLRESGCNFRVKFVGDGPERSSLEASVEAQGLQETVGFTGYLRGSELEKVMDDVAAVVMPSIWEETAGLAAIEHMMRGRLVIAADIGGLGEVVDESGLKFPPGDVDGLTACMALALDEPLLARSMGEKARTRALRLFQAERMVVDHIALYRHVKAL